MGIKGQISIEFIILVGFILIVVLGITSFLGEDIELIQAMSSARSGSIQGANMDSFAIYPQDSFENYNKNHLRLLCPSNVKIISIKYTKTDFNPHYNKTKIKLIITASCPAVNDNDRDALGDRINFYARKSICESFATSNMSNDIYNPAFSNRYFYTTAKVQWI